MASFDIKRESVIQLSRDIIKLSKRIIYALHRGDIKTASSLIKNIENDKKNLIKINIDSDTNIGKVALQEYAEAICYYEFVKNNKIPSKASLKIDSESYLLGICDLSGELMRKAVNEGIKGNFKQIIVIKDLIAEIYNEFLKFTDGGVEVGQYDADNDNWVFNPANDVRLSPTVDIDLTPGGDIIMNPTGDIRVFADLDMDGSNTIDFGTSASVPPGAAIGAIQIRINGTLRLVKFYST